MRPQDSFVEGDKDRISQVVYNLLNNAFKFSKDGSNITVNSKVEDSKIVVSVKDTGQGIDPEILPKLFSKFEAKSFSGSGLGLYICKNIIKAHGGKMWAQNNNIINGESGVTFRTLVYQFLTSIKTTLLDKDYRNKDCYRENICCITRM